MKRRADWHLIEDSQEAFEALKALFQDVYEDSKWRLDANEFHSCLYYATDSTGIRGAPRRALGYMPQHIPYNVVRSAIQTLTSKIAEQRPVPMVLANRGSWRAQRKARKTTQLLEGIFAYNRFFEDISVLVVRDGLLFGHGCAKVSADRTDVKIERIHPWDHFLDEWDSRHGTPRWDFHCLSIDRSSLEMEHGSIDAVEGAQRFRDTAAYESVNRDIDEVEVLEAWYTDERDGEGRHMVITTAGYLVDEPYSSKKRPIVSFTYEKPIVGTIGHGLAEQLEGFQYAVTWASEKLEEQYRMSGKLIMVPDDSKITNQQIRNGITVVNHRAGMQPNVFDMDLVNEHLRSRPRELIEDALRETGLSQLSVQAQKPAGITAGIALQTLTDNEADRFLVQHRGFAHFCQDIGFSSLEMAKMIAAEHGDFSVKLPLKSAYADLKWSDVEIDGFELRMFSVSALPQQMSARLERLTFMWEAQLIDRHTFLRHLDSPDIQSEMDLELADKILIDEVLDSMLDAEEGGDKDPYMAPSAYYDLRWAARRAAQKLNKAMLDGADEFNLDMLRTYIEQCEILLQRTEPPPQEAAAPQEGPPQ